MVGYMGCYSRNRASYYTFTGDTVTADATTATAVRVSGEYTYTSNTSYVAELLEEVKKKPVHPWMILPPSGVFAKPLMIFKSPVYDRKLLINAYKAASKK